MRPLLNVDLGELPGEPEELYALAHLASIACGGHAGDAASMAHAIERCRRLGARPGAHPSYPDRAGFGRSSLRLSADAVRAAVQGQCAELARIAGEALGHVKPHGALYHDADADPALAGAVVRGAADALGAPAIVGPAGGALQEAARSAGLPFLREAFADRGVDTSGRLLPRGAPGALIDDPAAAADRARALAPACDTICVHGDTPGAVAIARAVRAALDAMERGR